MNYSYLPPIFFKDFNKFSQFFEGQGWRDFYKHDASWVLGAKTRFLETHKTRDSLKENNFAQTLKSFIQQSEGCVLNPYTDSGSNWHIGYGLLIKSVGENKYTQVCVEAFSNVGLDLYKLIPVEQLQDKPNIKIKEYSINKEIANALFSFTLQKYINIVEDLIKKENLQLALNQKIALIDLAYNAPSLIGPKLKDALRNKDWNRCLYEIEQNSNNAKGVNWVGLQKRREITGAMFSSRATDVITRVPIKYFEKFLDQVKQDFPDFFAQLFSKTNGNMNYEDVKRIISCEMEGPDIGYIVKFMAKMA